MLENMDLPLAIWTPGPIEMLIVGIVALLIFGKRLPETAKKLGESFTAFKKGLKEGGENPPLTDGSSHLQDADIEVGNS